MQHLQPDTLLQNGKYKIERVLGQGGFGITYLASQTISIDGPIGSIKTEIKLAVKEFFMSEVCNRDKGSSHVSVPSVGSLQIVEQFKRKFLKEARNISGLNHPNIIKVVDVFEENGTAYYVMEYHGNGSLRTLLDSRHTLSEADALRYIRQIADALRYIHNRQMNHLDVKPDNILLDDSNNTVLIDFGLSKRYDDAGRQTSSTPVGISHGYAPLEQYRAGGVSEFSPATDIYSLGATLYRMLIGKNPPDANEVNEDGLPTMPASISSEIRTAIEAAMQPRRKDRPQNIDAFLSLLGNSKDTVDEEKTVIDPVHKSEKQKTKTDKTLIRQEASQAEKIPSVPSSKKKWLIRILISVISLPVICAVAYTLAGFIYYKTVDSEQHIETEMSSDSFTETVNGVSFNMIAVKGGTFTMGATPEQGDDAFDYNKPAHQVTLSDYYIGETEVTQELWQAVMGSNPSYFTGNLQRPVEQVSWNDCQEFIKKLNQLTGKTFRLPTEAEWEYAARGGSQSQGYMYAGSNTATDVAWIRHDFFGIFYGIFNLDATHSVGTKRPNELGLYDMSGNVCEWCQDWYEPYTSSSQTNPTGPSSGSNRVSRGGSWSLNAGYCRGSNRSDSTPTNGRYDNLGLRLAL